MKLILIALVLSSCSIHRYNQEAVNLKPETLAKYYTQCELRQVKPTKMGYKHIFVSAKNDTLIRYANNPMKVDSCYYVWKTKTDKP
jgi:hypothetical protein